KRQHNAVAAMCDVLQIARRTYYYEVITRDYKNEELTVIIVNISNKSRHIYGQRKIKAELENLGWAVSRRRIGRIMKEQGLVSKNTVAQFKPIRTTCNESKIGNVLNREFHQDQELKVVVSDLT